MPRKVKMNWRGKPVEGEEIDFEPLAEKWNEYRLSDGSLVKLKLVISRIVRLGEYNEQGEPIYVISSQNVVSTTVPPELMKEY